MTRLEAQVAQVPTDVLFYVDTLEHLRGCPDRYLLEERLLVTIVIVDQRLADAGGVRDVLHAQLGGTLDDQTPGSTTQNPFGGIPTAGWRDIRNRGCH